MIAPSYNTHTVERLPHLLTALESLVLFFSISPFPGLPPEYIAFTLIYSKSYWWLISWMIKVSAIFSLELTINPDLIAYMRFYLFSISKSQEMELHIWYTKVAKIKTVDQSKRLWTMVHIITIINIWEFYLELNQ